MTLDELEVCPFCGREKVEWISVKDKLPKSIINKVIVCCKNGYVGFGHYERISSGGIWFNLESALPFTDWDLDDCETYEVTHWMPLPPGTDGG